MIAEALHLTTDALLGATPIKRAATPRNSCVSRVQRGPAPRLAQHIERIGQLSKLRTAITWRRTATVRVVWGDFEHAGLHVRVLGSS